MLQERPLDVVATLQPVRRRLGWTQVARWTLRGLGAGAGVGIAALLAAHLIALPPIGPLALAAIALGAVAGAVLGAGRRPDSLRTARLVDRHFGLQDRLTTALELRSSNQVLAILQRNEAAGRLRHLELTACTRRQIRRRELSVPALATAGLVALLFWAGVVPTRTQATVAAADQQRIHRAALVQVPQLTRKLEHGLTPATQQNPEVRKLEAALAALRRQLLLTPDRRSALRAISATQQQLQRLAASLHPVNKQAVAQLTSSLARYMTRQQRTAAGTRGRQALQAAAQLLNELARKLGHQSAAQRASLARALAQAANATSESRLRASLHQAASSLAYGDPTTASSALRQAAAALAGTPNAQRAQSLLQRTSSQLDSLKKSVVGAGAPSGQAPSATGGAGQNEPGAGAPGQGQADTGKGTGNGRGSSQGRGTGGRNGSGQGSASGRGTGHGSGSGSGQAQGGVGGRGIGGGRGGAGPHGQGRYATVYVPARQGKGPHTSQTGPSGAPQPGGVVPYQQVVGRYARAAHAALDRSPLPPGLRSYARRYFTAISH